MSLLEAFKSMFEYKQPEIKDNTFIVWEPCTKNHSEVVPGYVKYLLDLGYHVSVCITPDRYEEGLFSRFELDNQNLSLNDLTQKEIKKFFHKNNLEKVKGVLVTTSGKLYDRVHYEQCYKYFNKNVDKTKLYFVEHDVQKAVDANLWNEKFITLRQMNYKGVKSVVINPQYFGNVEITSKNKITNFVTIGEIKKRIKNADLFIQSAEELVKRGITNFKITVIGKGHLSDIPENVRHFFDIKGRLDFENMYKEIENSDFLITSYDIPDHIRYNTTGTSGNFQLVYGFLKPVIIKEDFAEINGFTDENSILYKEDGDFVEAMITGINMSDTEYAKKQEKLKDYSQNLYRTSLKNLKELING